jgi:flagellar M-ring protein FliF
MALLPVSRETFESVRGRSRAALAGFTTGQKVMTVLAVVAVVVGGYVFMHAESKPNYQPLFTNLQASDSGAVTAQLTTAKVPYQLSNGGATVLVPAADVDQERVALAEQGLPDSGTVGFTNLEKGGITTSEFVQQVEYQQALEGQLQQTIESIQGVQSAKVNLVVPEQSAFAIGSQPATTASILVDLNPGTSLSSGQVQAIVHLAASATPSLTASNVTVVDNHGDVLSSPGGTSSGNGSSNSQQTNAYDNQLSSSVEGLLDRVVGVGNSAVQVHALLNFNQQSTTTKGVQTNAQGQPITAPTSQNSSTQTYTGSGTPPSGVLGSSQPPAATTASGNGNYNTSSTQVTNAVGQVSQTVQQAPGQVEKTSIAVLLNSDATKKVSDAQVKSLVTAAAGLNPTAGDQLVVSSMPFANNSGQSTAAAQAASAADRQQLLEHGAEVLGLVLLIAGMLFFALRAARRRPSYDEVQLPELAPLRSMIPLDDEVHPTGELPAVARTPVLDAVPDAVLSQVNNYIEQRPAEAARLLRAWADERSTESV